MKKIAIYSRKSKFTEKGESIENQIEMCKIFIKQKFKEVNLEKDIIIYEDEGFSGGTVKRPHFKRMMEDAQEQKISIIICYRLDRLSRNISDFSKLIDELGKLNIEFISVKENFETHTPMGKAMMYISSIFSQLEREVIAERIKDNMMELAKTGRWLGGITPTGYTSKCIEKISSNGKMKKRYMLIQEPKEVEKIKIIFEKYLELKSLTKLETYLLNEEINSKFFKDYTRFSLKNILSNIVYVKNDLDIYNYLKTKNLEIYADKKDFDGKRGMIAYNKTMQRKNIKNSRLNKINEWVISVGNHEGIISGAEFIKVQKILSLNNSMRYKKGEKTESLLSGMIYCGECGSHMRPKAGKNNYIDGKRRFYYMCELKEKSKKNKCEACNIDGNLADKLVLEEIEKLLKLNDLSHEKLKVISYEFEAETYFKEKKELTREYRKNEQIINDLLEKIKYVDKSIVTEISGEIKRIKNANKEIKKKIYQVENPNFQNKQEVEYIIMMMDVLNSYKKTLYKLDYKEKRNIIKELIAKVEADGKNIKIKFPIGNDCE